MFLYNNANIMTAMLMHFQKEYMQYTRLFSDCNLGGPQNGAFSQKFVHEQEQDYTSKQYVIFCNFFVLYGCLTLRIHTGHISKHLYTYISDVQDEMCKFLSLSRKTLQMK